MTLKTLGSRTFAALTFGALTLHGIATVTPPAPDVTPGGGSSYRRQDTTQADAYRHRQARDESEIVAILSVLIHEGII